MLASCRAATAVLVLAAGASAPAATAPAPLQVIALYSYGYEPHAIVLAAQRPVTLTFVNRAGRRHDFTAGEFFRSARILSGNVERGEIDLGAGQATSVTLVPAAGHYRVHCGRFLHKQLGMSAEIVVR